MTEDINREDIENMSDESGVKEEIIESSLEIKRANEKFNRYKNQNSDNQNQDQRSTSDIIKNALIFIPKLFIDTRHGPIKGVVTDIKNPKGSDELIVEVTAEHNKIADKNEENPDYGKVEVSKKVSYDLKEETEEIEYLLNKTDSKNIGDMVGKNIPISAESTSGGHPTQDITEKPYNIADKISNIISVYGDYFRIREECQPFEDSTSGEYGWNLNFVLFGTLLIGGLSILFSKAIFNLGIPEYAKMLISIPGIIGMVLSVIGCILYLSIISVYLWKCASELIYKNPDERYVIREVINS